MDIQKQVAFEKFHARDCNCDYEDLKRRLDRHELLTGHRYPPTSPRHEAWLTWCAAWDAKAQAVPEEKGRSDFEIIAQTIELVDLIASSNRFQRDKSTPFPFESNNPRNIEWWRLACKIQELLTDTDPDNCDFEEYKAMIEAQEPAND
ncbi:hypothetical protein [Acinetobacter sp. YH12145]|uniref:hypothetical protein n=1 Tax=Acinetobacter sp. YH12145 TaxID=2601129 RepID=UPI00211DBC42|nr:hypothetical protein [Acinetobacter sp. YH12145]